MVERGKVITGAGVSSGIDMGLTLAAKLFDEETAKIVQLAIEYDPQPPFDSGAPSKVTPSSSRWSPRSWASPPRLTATSSAPHSVPAVGVEALVVAEVLGEHEPVEDIVGREHDLVVEERRGEQVPGGRFPVSTWTYLLTPADTSGRR